MFDLLLGLSLLAGAILAVSIMAVLARIGRGGFIIATEMATSFFVLAVISCISIGLTFLWFGLSILALTVIKKTIVMVAVVVGSMIVSVILVKAFKRVLKPLGSARKLAA